MFALNVQCALSFSAISTFLLGLRNRQDSVYMMVIIFGPNSTETELIDASVDGQHHAFRELVRRYEGVVAATVIGMLGPNSDADDIGQEAMIRLYRALPKFRNEATMKTFVTRIVINLCLDTIRQHKRKVWQFWRTEDDDGLDYIPDQKSLSKEIELKQSIHKAVQCLKPDYRSVAVLRLIQGYSTEETSDMLNIPVGTVLSRLSRAKNQLKQELAEYVRD